MDAPQTREAGAEGPVGACDGEANRRGDGRPGGCIPCNAIGPGAGHHRCRCRCRCHCSAGGRSVRLQPSPTGTGGTPVRCRSRPAREHRIVEPDETQTCAWQ